MITTEKLLEGRKGIRFFADVQGCYAPFAELVDDALSQNLALFSLGDLIDRGPDSPSVMRLACDLYDAGLLDIVPGNHDEKYVRFIQGRPVSTERGLGDTLRQLLKVPDSKQLTERYFDFISEANVWRRFASGLHVVHAAIHAKMLGENGPRVMDGVSQRSLRYLALYGETDGTEDPLEPGRPNRLFNWVDRLPAGSTILVGHSVISTETIVERRGALGGRVLHLDTGVDRGGKLSYLDISAEMLTGETPLRLPSFPDVGSLTPAVTTVPSEDALV